MTTDEEILAKYCKENTHTHHHYQKEHYLAVMKLAREDGFKDGYQECVKDINPKSYTGLLMAKITKLENALREIAVCDHWLGRIAKKALQEVEK